MPTLARQTNCCSHAARLAAFVLVALLGVGMGSAFSPLEEDARSFSMEVAAPYLKKGFKLRAEQWSGEIKYGEQTPVKFQLFKGNQYWFWAGSSDEKSTVSVNVYDTDGKSVASRKIRWKKGKGGVRVVPPVTGTYIVVITIESKTEDNSGEKIGWALAYGYR
jgi:hypothetical protein